MDDQLLTGIRVLDLSQDIAGPYMTRLMAGLGADVTKVEPPSGDPSRRAGPFPDHIPHREKSGLYLYLNTSKRGVTLDIHTQPPGATCFYVWRRASTWWSESFRPGTLDEAGLGYDALSQDQPPYRPNLHHPLRTERPLQPASRRRAHPLRHVRPHVSHRRA